MMKYREEGMGDPIVLVPGGLTGCVSWEPHAARLAVRNKVVRVQLISVEYGRRMRPLPQDYSQVTESVALKEAVDETVPEGKIDLAAWSFGAAVALIYALDNPERVRTLTLIEPPAFWVLEEEPTDPGFTQLRRLGEEIKGDVSEEQLARFTRTVGISPPKVDPRMLPQWPLWMKYRRSLLNTYAVFTYHDDPRRLHDFRAPVLLVKGTGSAPFLHAVIDTLNRQFPIGEVVEYPEGHAPHIVSLERFLEKFSTFMAMGGALHP